VGESAATNGKGREVRILFLGQCLLYGYYGVRPDQTFPLVTKAFLLAQFPAVKFKIDLKHLYYPTGLKALLRHRLLFTRPDIVVIGLPAMFAATEWRVNMIYDIAPEIVDTARTFMRKIEAAVAGRASYPQKQATSLDKTFARKGPISLENYETLVSDAIADAKRTGSCRLILMGPGRFNEDTSENYELHSPELWFAVNEMLAGVAKRHEIPFIDAQEALGEHGGEVYMAANHRFSPWGHEVVAREVTRVIASQLNLSLE
jgi:hypothetical protein